MRPLILLVLLSPAPVLAQPPPGYYDPAAGLSGEPLRAALYGIISPHTVIQYSNLWSAFYRTDRKQDNTVWDMYSDVPGGTPSYSYQFVSDQCGTYNSEGDCFNREHSFPTSWFNDVPPMNSDLFHIFPTDAWVNQARGSWPYGTVSSPDFTSSNGGKRGPCTWPGCSGTVFEPINEYKGDLARGHFYMLTRYMNESVSWTTPIMTGGQLFSWTESLLLAWHTQDPVSAKEIARNDSAFILQGNRNPYIDNPQWAYSIWGPQAAVTEHISSDMHAWFDNDLLVVQRDETAPPTDVLVADVTGRVVVRARVQGGRTTVRFAEPMGTYAVRSMDQPGAIRLVR